MTKVLPTARRPHHVDPDPTARDTHPWHLDLDIDMEEVTGVRPTPPGGRMQIAVVAKGLVPLPVTPRATPLPPRPAARPLSEVVELLSVPGGLREEAFRVGDQPKSPAEVRIAIVRMVRGLARDYRRWYGCSLRTDAAAVELMQRHLLGHAGEVLAGRMEARSLAPEVVRHGALLGEILARRAGGVWVDVAGEQPALWQMAFPMGTAFRPIGRVHRFLLQRDKEEDLVAEYLRLEAASR